jgi:hypothetical protein
MAAMSDETTPAPVDLEWRVMSSLETEPAVVSSVRAPLALAAAVASMAAAVIIWRLSPRIAG